MRFVIGRVRLDYVDFTLRQVTKGVSTGQLTNVVSRVLLLPSYTADEINPFKLGAVLQKHGDHKTSDNYIEISPTNVLFVTFGVVITHFGCF